MTVATHPLPIHPIDWLPRLAAQQGISGGLDVNHYGVRLFYGPLTGADAVVKALESSAVEHRLLTYRSKRVAPYGAQFDQQDTWGEHHPLVVPYPIACPTTQPGSALRVSIQHCVVSRSRFCAGNANDLPTAVSLALDTWASRCVQLHRLVNWVAYALWPIWGNESARSEFERIFPDLPVVWVAPEFEQRVLRDEHLAPINHIERVVNTLRLYLGAGVPASALPLTASSYPTTTSTPWRLSIENFPPDPWRLRHYVRP